MLFFFLHSPHLKQTTAMWKGKGLCFASGREESYQHLTVRGEIPPWLCGSMYRVGPGLLEVSQNSRYKHWFDGLALLHRYALGPMFRFV